MWPLAMHFRTIDLLFALGLGSTVNAATNLTSLVNLFIGTSSGANGGSGGNGFPGEIQMHHSHINFHLRIT